jgi:DNA-binding NarL/FixJ family response regulator
MNEFLEILLVDDDALVRQVLRQVLKNYYPQCQISEAESVDSALAQVDERRWDLIILDLGLGEKSGLSVIHKVNVQNLNIPILVLSAQKNQDAAIPAFRAGARGFISKNEAVGSHQLSQAIEKVLAGGKYVSEGLAAQLVDAMDIIKCFSILPREKR